MRTAAAFVFGFVVSSAAYGAGGVPSDQVLAEMGLGGLQIVSDAEAAEIRGMGFSGADAIKEYHKAIRNYHKDVFKLHKAVREFHHDLAKALRQKQHDMKPPTMKPPKTNHGGSRW